MLGLRKLKLLAGLLSSAMVLSIVPANLANAIGSDTFISYEGQFPSTEKVYRSVEDYSYSAEVKTVSTWSGHANMEIKFTNTGSSTIHDWYFTFDYNYAIENPYNCYIVEQEENLYTIGNNDWNQDIRPGQSVTIGFTAASSNGSAITDKPSFYLLNTKTISLGSSDLSYRFEQYSDWGSGYNGALILTNNSGEKIRDWKITFSSNRPITQVDSASFTANSDGTYTISNDGNNQNIGNGQSYRIGIQGGAHDASVAFGLSDFSVSAKKLAYSLNDDKNNNGILDVLEIDYEGNIPVITTTPVDTVTPTPTVIDVTSPTPTPVPTDTDTPTPTDTPVPTVPIEDIDWDTDTDEDHIPDDYEAYFGTDMNDPDSDDDGVLDGYEILVELDPINPDTDGDGISDGDEDYDGDGLTNKVESSIGSNLASSDSDMDGLSDYEEVNTYKTSPIDWDTDDDEISDYDEVQLGLNPKQTDSNGNGIPDGEEKILQSKTVNLSDDEHPEGILSVTVEAAISGYIQTNTFMEDCYFDGCISSLVDGSVGVPVDIFTYGSFDEATVTFKYDESIVDNVDEDNLAICWIDYENGQIVPLNSTVNKTTHTVSATTTHFSQYVLMDLQQYADMWGRNIIYANQIQNKIEQKQHLDIILACQMSRNMTMDQREQAWTAIRKMTMDLKPGDRLTIVGFGETSNASGLLYAASGDDLASKNYILEQTIGDWDDGSGKSLGDHAAMDWVFYGAYRYFEEWLFNDEMRTRQLVVFTNGEDSIDADYANICANAGHFDINIVMVGNNSVSSFASVYTPTNGSAIQMSGSGVTPNRVPDILYGDFEGKTDPTKDSDVDANGNPDPDGIPDLIEDYPILTSYGYFVRTDPTNPDTDYDTLRDNEELTYQVYVKAYLGWIDNKTGLYIQGYRYDDFMANYGQTITNDLTCYVMISNPELPDSDFDDAGDAVDATPMKPNGKINYILVGKDKDGEDTLSSMVEPYVNAFKSQGEKVVVLEIYDGSEYSNKAKALMKSLSGSSFDYFPPCTLVKFTFRAIQFDLTASTLVDKKAYSYVDKMIIIAHGSSLALQFDPTYIRQDSDENDGAIGAQDVPGLNPICDIYLLDIQACNCGKMSSQFNTCIAYEFANKSQIKKVYAWTGKSSYFLNVNSSYNGAYVVYYQRQGKVESALVNPWKNYFAPLEY